MCGIFAILPSNHISHNEIQNVIDNGLNKIRHRGPDGKNIFIDKSLKIGLGHVRLSIIDIDNGSQPMTIDDRYTIIFNGEIYNYIELRNDLGPENFRTFSDTEVILHAYKKWGSDCVIHLRGMFAFVIWDNFEQKLFFARDRFGIKPLYKYKNKNGSIFIASEIKAFNDILDNKEINNHALKDYFKFQYYLGNKTLMNDVFEIPPASSGFIDKNLIFSEKKYWNVEFNVDHNKDDLYFENQLKNIITESINLHTRSDVEVGGYVSGGIDSSLVSILASQNLNKKNSFKAFNGRFDHADFDESEYAKIVANENNMELLTLDITEDDFINNINNVIYFLDNPVAGPGSFAQYMISQEASKKVKVILGGQGGDEIFGGYARYLIAYMERCVEAAIDGTLKNGKFIVDYQSIIPSLETLKNYKPLIKDFWSTGLFGPINERYLKLIDKSHKIKPFINKDIFNNDNNDEFNSIFFGNTTTHQSYFDLMTHYDFQSSLPALLQVEDRMSMAHGLESRVPFLDHNIIELAAKAPANIKFLNGELKRLLKRTFKDEIPKKILNRKDKMGFPVPLNLWIKNKKTSEFVGDIFNSNKAKTRPYLNSNFSVDNFLDDQNIFNRNLWIFLSLELWCQNFIDN
jgi:asparagine synthase (glutamine-hydrolysing)